MNFHIRTISFIFMMFTFASAFSQDISEAERERQEYLREIELKNRPGTVASDFRFVTKDGHESSLHEFNTDGDIILLFYDPDCDHCISTIEELQTMDLPHSVKVLAIDVAADRHIWEASQHLISDTWICGFALDSIEDDETYILLEMPTIYLLSPNKTVIQKDTSLPQLLQSLIGKP